MRVYFRYHIIIDLILIEVSCSGNTFIVEQRIYML
jgi:hypothetical protein